VAAVANDGGSLEEARFGSRLRRLGRHKFAQPQAVPNRVKSSADDYINRGYLDAAQKQLEPMSAHKG
jgi:hypothetical protein